MMINWLQKGDEGSGLHIQNICRIADSKILQQLSPLELMLN